MQKNCITVIIPTVILDRFYDEQKQAKDNAVKLFSLRIKVYMK